MPGTLEDDETAVNGENAKTARKTATRGATAKPATETAAAEGDGAPRLVITPIQTETLLIPIRGLAPLIVSRFSDKAKRQMLEAQQGVKREKAKRDPGEEFQNSLYRAGRATAADAARLSWSDPDLIDEDGNPAPFEYVVSEGDPLYGLPAMAFKMATISAARLYGKAVKMTELRQFMYFDGLQIKNEPNRMVVIQGVPQIREDYVRLAGINRPADLRYRGCFYNWRATLTVRYTKNLLDRSSLISLIEAGGMTVGVGEWRPERDGEFGTFCVGDGIQLLASDSNRVVVPDA